MRREGARGRQGEMMVWVGRDVWSQKQEISDMVIIIPCPCKMEKKHYNPLNLSKESWGERETIKETKRKALLFAQESRSTLVFAIPSSALCALVLSLVRHFRLRTRSIAKKKKFIIFEHNSVSLTSLCAAATTTEQSNKLYECVILPIYGLYFKNH